MILKPVQEYFRNEETPASLALAVFIGIGTGFGAIGFRMLIEFFRKFFFGGGSNVLGFMGGYYVLLVPAAGGLIVGPLVYFFAREAKGHGVPEVMAAVALKNGVIRPRVVLVKALASAVCMGSGGSVGREGPIVQIGSAIGSTVGQICRVPVSKLRAYVACGAAGGIAATFNAPIGGVLFALEVILGEFSGGHLVLVIISAVSASVISHIFLGNAPAFSVPAYPLNNPWELFFYALLGIVAGGFAVIYIKTLYWFEDLFDAIKSVPEYFKPVIGGLLVGLIGLFFPHVFGVGYESIEKSITGQMVISLTAALIVMKLLATSITIGSGGSGGVFAPGLFMGSMLGATFGMVLHRLAPAVASTPAAYALVGMGAVFAGSAQAPITAILILFEMSSDYHIILPLMITCIISAVVARSIYSDNIYTVKLVRRGLDLESARSKDLFRRIPVRAAMAGKLEVVPYWLTVEKAYSMIENSPHQGFPVTDGDNTILGVITRYDLYSAINGGRSADPVQEVCSGELILALPDEPLSVASRKLARNNIGRLPVVESLETKKLVGMLTRTDIISAYNSSLKPGGADSGGPAQN